MANVTMPPVSVIVESGYELRWAGAESIAQLVARTGAKPGSVFITTEQAEAYAAAKVREALECVSREVHNVLHPANPREDWTQYAYIREEAAHDAESAIRALIPQHDNK